MSALIAQALPDAASSPSPRRVLLVEDDPLQARGLLRLLDLHGVSCHNVPTAKAALEAVASQSVYNLIVSDLGLPGLAGAELATRLRRPLLVSYSGGWDRPRWFDVHVDKPRVAELLLLLSATRLTVVFTSLPDGECLGHAQEPGILCRASSPVHALRMLATAIESSGAH